MYLIFALASAFSTAAGTFLTRPLIQKLPAFQVIGPLFLLNAVAALPFVAIRQDWVALTLTQSLEILLLGALTALSDPVFLDVITVEFPAQAGGVV